MIKTQAANPQNSSIDVFTLYILNVCMWYLHPVGGAVLMMMINQVPNIRKKTRKEIKWQTLYCKLLKRYLNYRTLLKT